MSHTDPPAPLSGLALEPYLHLALGLARLPRKGGGTMFRHQMDTLAVLLEYGHRDPVLLRAAVVHDVLEDLPDVGEAAFAALPDGAEVLAVVREVSRGPDEPKATFLRRVHREGSRRARLLKVADRISNLGNLGQSGDPAFVRRYVLESALEVYPTAQEVSPEMAAAMRELLEQRLAELGGDKNP